MSVLVDRLAEVKDFCSTLLSEAGRRLRDGWIRIAEVAAHGSNLLPPQVVRATWAGIAGLGILYLLIPFFFPCGLRSCTINQIIAAAKSNPEFVDETGKTYAFLDPARGRIVSANSTPVLSEALRVSEDQRFWDRTLPQLDFEGVLRALWSDLRARRILQGGSGAVQQLARTLFRIPYRGIRRKMAELGLATVLAHRLTREEIWHLYANSLYLGRGNYGVDAAARSIFGKAAENLTAGEAALIAKLPPGPRRRDPAVDLARATEVRDLGLTLMMAHGLISPIVAAEERRRPIRFVSREKAESQKGSAAASLMRRAYGQCFGVAGPALVATDLNSRLQQALEAAFDRAARHGWTLAGIAISPTGSLLAAVGPVSSPAPLNSLIKPFTVGIAREEGRLSLGQPLQSLPVPRMDQRTQEWYGRLMRACRVGQSVARALASSDNCSEVVAFGVLGKAGRARFGDFGLPVPGGNLAQALGLIEDDLITVTTAYSVFRDGVRRDLSILRGCGSARKRVLTTSTAREVLSALEGTVRFGTLASASRSWPGRREAVAGKTGSGPKNHGLVLIARDVTLGLMITRHEGIAGFASQTVGPEGFRILFEAIGKPSQR